MAKKLQWQATKNEAYLQLVKMRLQQVDLAWVNQFLDLLQERCSSDAAAISLNDIGCQAFQFYKQMKKRGIAWTYFGVDLEDIYIRIGLQSFPELTSRFALQDIVGTLPPEADISVCSATIEHIPDWRTALINILSTTRQVCIIRTFLGSTTSCATVRQKGAREDYPIWEFGTPEILQLFDDCGFTTAVLRDRYTDSMPKFLSHDYETKGIVRTQYVILAERTVEPTA